MMPIWVFLRDVPVSASEFQVPRAACRSSTPYSRNLLPLTLVLVAQITAGGVDLCVADSLVLQSSAISGATAEVKSP